MKWTLCIICAAGALGLAAVPAVPAADPPSAAADVAFPLDLAIVDPDSREKQPPYIVMFETGVDQNEKKVLGPLGRLEALRGPSKMFPESNKDDGLPVVLRGLRFHRLLGTDGKLEGYEVELQGEYNMVKVPVNAGEMKKFLSGERVSFSLSGQANYGVYAYASAIKMEVRFRGSELFIYKVDGDFSFREGFTTYTSKTKKLSPPAGREYIYRGEAGKLPTLPSI